MICLEQEQPFALGGRRACYFHPEDGSLCIKVARADKLPHMLRSVDPWWKRIRPASYYDENKLDMNIGHKLRARLGDAATDHFPSIHGTVETDLGIGLVCELIRDPDERISLSGKEYTLANGLRVEATDAIKELRSFLKKHLILFRDPFPHNIAIQEQTDGSVRAVIIDGLGRGAFLSPLFKDSARKRIDRKIDRLLKGMHRAESNKIKGVRPKQNGILLKR
jgi:hypothetical protein